MSVDANIVMLVGIVAVVIIIYMLRDKLNSLGVKVGRFLNLTIKTDKGKPTESYALMSSINGSSDKKIDDEALKTLKWIQEEIEEINGSYIYSDSTLKNKKIATLLYTKCTKKLIGTAFFEDPNNYKDDLAAFVDQGIEFVRITTGDVCSQESQKGQKEKLRSFQSNARLVVVPADTGISKLGGLFCEMKDGSHLAFIALNNVGNKGENHGLVFCGDTAEHLFKYYESWVSL